MAGGKNTMAVFISQFLLPFLSTIHPALIHILKNCFNQTGGKDRCRIIVAKCFLSAGFANSHIRSLSILCRQKLSEISWRIVYPNQEKTLRRSRKICQGAIPRIYYISERIKTHFPPAKF